MTTITLNLSDSIVHRAGRAAHAMHRPLEETITAILDGALPSLDDVPQDMRTELVEMTWWEDAKLVEAADATLLEIRQKRMIELSATDRLSDLEKKEIDSLRREYGRVTLRKARALALLSVRSGKRLLTGSDAA